MKTKWENDKNRTRVIGYDGGGCRCHVCDLWGNTLKEIDEHGKLISAAPELLDACKKMQSFINNLPDGGDYELVEEAQQAIEKAESHD